MIIVKYHDGSEGYRYEAGDIVRINGTIEGGWFNTCVGRTGTVYDIEKNRHPDIATFYVKYAPDWGGAHCACWEVFPEDVTYATATIVYADK
jgi:hypothetical protein